MYSPTTRYEYRTQAIKRGKQVSASVSGKSWFYECLIAICLVTTSLAYILF